MNLIKYIKSKELAGATVRKGGNRMAEHAIVTFPNGYKSSIIRGPYSYGGDQGLFELAVLDAEGCIDYSTPITEDVLGYLSKEDVIETLKQIAALPSK